MIEHARFDTATVGPRERFDYWRERVVPLRLEPAGASPRGFQVAAESLHAGSVAVIEMRRGAARASWRRESFMPRDRLQLIVIGRAPGAGAHWYGDVVSLAGGGVALVGANDGWWDAPGGLHGIEVDLPRSAVEVSDAELIWMNDARLPHDPVFSTLIRPMLVGMVGNLGALAATASAERFSAEWTSLITMLIRSLSGRDLSGVDVGLARRLQAERYVRAHLHDPRLDPDAVAAALHLSRRALYATVFRGDAGVATYIRRARLERARRLLGRGTAPVAAVGTAVGLPDPAHFSRLFRAEYGYSPRELRAQRTN